MLGTVEAAAWNNAAWCDAFCRTHGISGSFGTDRWTCARRTPPLYPDAITLTPSAEADPLLRLLDTSPGCSVKDSFATLDLAPAGFRVLFGAVWMHHDAPVPAASAGRLWSVVTEPEDLEIWEGGWGDGDSTMRMFLPALLEIDEVVVFGERDEGGFSSGVVANRANGVVGVTNFFTHGEPDEAWARCITTVARSFPDVPIVGYESGDDLGTACSQGFKPLGPLRVWLMP
jgi:hypothetical protein